MTRRCIYLPVELSRQVDYFAGRLNVSMAAANGIEAMVRAAEADPSFTMVGRHRAQPPEAEPERVVRSGSSGGVQ